MEKVEVMKINKRWYLNGDLKPVSFDPLFGAIKKQFDSVTIIHYPSDLDFRPIVLRKDDVKSWLTWEVATFYKGALRAIEVCSYPYDRTGLDDKGYYICHHSDMVNWGCRKFTMKQLLLIKRTMEQEYTKKQLGVK